MSANEYARIPKVGDDVLAYGNRLTITAITAADGRQVCKCENIAEAERRAAAVARERVLRAREWRHLSAADQAKHWDEVNAAASEASAALVRLGLRADLLLWWAEKECWVSDGRILSDAQIAAWKRIAGDAPKPAQQRHALLTLERLAAAE